MIMVESGDSKVFPLIIRSSDEKQAGTVSAGQLTTIYHVKLTDSCLSALDDLAAICNKSDKKKCNFKQSSSSANTSLMYKCKDIVDPFNDYTGSIQIRDNAGALKLSSSPDGDDGSDSSSSAINTTANQNSSIDSKDNTGNVNNFRFAISDISSMVAKGQMEAIVQIGGDGNNDTLGVTTDDGHMEVVGVITHRLKILTTDKESFESTKQKARQEIAEAKKHAEKIAVKMKTSGSSSKATQKIMQKLNNSKSVVPSTEKIRADRPLTPVHSLLSATKSGGGTGTGAGGGISAGLAAKLGASVSANKYGDLARKSLRQRVIQHLALKPSKPGELLARLTKEGLMDEDRQAFEAIVNDVAQLKQNVSPNNSAAAAGSSGTPSSCSVGGEYELRPSCWSDVRTDWPHYSKWDSEMVKKSVAARLIQNSSSGSTKAPSIGIDSFIGRKDDVGKTRVVPPPPPSNRGGGRNDATTTSAAASASAAADSCSSPTFASPLDTIIPEILSQEGGRRRIAQKRRIATAADNKSAPLTIIEQQQPIKITTAHHVTESNASTSSGQSPSSISSENVTKRAKAEKPPTSSVQSANTSGSQTSNAEKTSITSVLTEHSAKNSASKSNSISTGTDKVNSSKNSANALQSPIAARSAQRNATTYEDAVELATSKPSATLHQQLNSNSNKCLSSSNTQNKLPNSISNNNNNVINAGIDNKINNGTNHNKAVTTTATEEIEKQSEYLNTLPSANTGEKTEARDEKDIIIDYYEQFPSVYTEEDRQKYKQIFDTDYPQYMLVYDQLEKAHIFKDIEKLGQRMEQLKCQQKQQTNEYKSVEREIFRKYKKFAENSSLVKCKSEHDRLRSKLAVLKERILEFDRNLDAKEIIPRYV